jgi:hypothetical protein
LMTTFLAAIVKKKLKVIQLPITALKWFTALNGKANLFKKLSPLINTSLNTNSVLDISKIQKELNYKPSKNFYNSFQEIDDRIITKNEKKVDLKQFDPSVYDIKNTRESSPIS